MYAVIETGGKQYRVEVGTELEVELLDAEPGKTVTVGRVLLVADGDEASIGRPVVDGATVSAQVLRQGRGAKVIAFKYRPKARRRVKKGHRQELTVLRISDITLNGKSAAESVAKADTAAKTERQRLAEAAAAQAAKDAELAAKLAARSTAAARTPAKKKTDPKAAGTKTTGPKAADATARTETKAKAKAETAGDATTEPRAEATSTPKASTTKKSTTRPKPADAEPSPDEPAPKKTAARPRSTKKDG